MRWSELVREGKNLLATESATQWALGDLALAVAPMGMRGATTGVNELLQKWADEIGYERSLLTLLQLRFVANSWPEETRVKGVSYSTHYALSSLQNRFELIHPGMKVAEARELAGRKPAKQTQVTYGVRPERVIQSLRDPRMLEMVLRDDEIRAAIMATLSPAPSQEKTSWLTRLFQAYPAAA